MRASLCPSCEGKGSVPDNFPGGRIKCPKCGCKFEIAGPSATKPSIRTQTPVPRTPPTPVRQESIFDGLDGQATEPVAAGGQIDFGGHSALERSSGTSPWLFNCDPGLMETGLHFQTQNRSLSPRTAISPKLPDKFNSRSAATAAMPVGSQFQRVIATSQAT
jgi:hypothetical protein